MSFVDEENEKPGEPTSGFFCETKDLQSQSLIDYYSFGPDYLRKRSAYQQQKIKDVRYLTSLANKGNSASRWR
jgi:hypothetical protein